MAKRSNHYDLAFEELLRRSRIPYVCVDETRRALLRDASLKSMDFIAYAEGQANLLIDVKGRRYPGGNFSRQRWKNWALEEDIECLLKWEQVFGQGFRAVLVFAYDIVSPRYEPEHARRLSFRGRTYAFYGVWVDEYEAMMRTGSQSWETVFLPAAAYRRLRAPIDQFLGRSSLTCLQTTVARAS